MFTRSCRAVNKDQISKANYYKGWLLKLTEEAEKWNIIIQVFYVRF